MGKRFIPANASNPTGFFEDLLLAQICRSCYLEPRMVPQYNHAKRVELLDSWLQQRKAEEKGNLFGAKHPTLCLMGPEILDLGEEVRWISVERPLQEAIESLLNLGWGWGPDLPQQVLPKIVDTRDRFLSGIDENNKLRIQYSALLESPLAQIERMVSFLQIQPDEEQLLAATEFVDPNLNPSAQ